MVNNTLVVSSFTDSIYHRRNLQTKKQVVTSVNIPWQSLSDDALRGVIEEFVTREGTEYGSAEVSLDQKCAEVARQLAAGEAIITYDEVQQTCSIVANH
jgi:uncharacterized protein YheU (UPF0270 family)